MSSFTPQRSVRGRLLRYFIIIILIFSTITVMSLILFQSTLRTLASFQQNLLDIHSIAQDINLRYTQIENFVSSGNRDYLTGFSESMDRHRSLIQDLRRRSESDLYYPLVDLEKMLISFDEEAMILVDLVEQDTERIYVSKELSYLRRMGNYIIDEVTEIQGMELDAGQLLYQQATDRVTLDENISYLLISVTIILCIAFAVRYSRQIAVPIHSLAERLQEFAAGDLDISPMEVHERDEVGVLIDSFNHMTAEIREHIHTTQRQAVLERRLAEQGRAVIEAQSLQKQAELELLQSQINPHFLFNTLNSVGALADIEEAERTRDMVASLSHILRFALKRSKELIPLGEEVETVRHYMAIQKVRYGNRIAFHEELEEEALDCQIPGMCLQPFIENALIHGIEPKEGLGEITLGITRSGDYTEIRISDTGLGIPPDRLAQLNRDGGIGGESMGIANVRRRLKLFDPRSQVVIESKPAGPTEVYMRLYTRVNAQISDA